VGGIFSFLFVFIIVPLVVGFVVYWIIRAAVFGGMRDFEQWKHKQYGASDDYDYDYEQP
jgi:hypothetical protein